MTTKPETDTPRTDESLADEAFDRSYKLGLFQYSYEEKTNAHAWYRDGFLTARNTDNVDAKLVMAQADNIVLKQELIATQKALGECSGGYETLQKELTAAKNQAHQYMMELVGANASIAQLNVMLNAAKADAERYRVALEKILYSEASRDREPLLRLAREALHPTQPEGSEKK